MNNLLFAAAVGCALLFWSRKLKDDLQMLQQNSYRSDRYWRWIRHNPGRCLKKRDFIPILVLILVLFDLPTAAAVSFTLYYLLRILWREQRKDKLKLVFTPRAKRLFALAVTLAALCGALCLFFLVRSGGFGIPSLGAYTALTLLSAMSFLTLAAANGLLAPLEKGINDRYFRDAQRIIREMPSLKVIGLTGSFGKTSTKNFLVRILAAQFQVLTTPGSYNTPMGVTKVIRTLLKPIHEIFVVEMGAKQPGDIRELCDLAQPSIGIITAIGEQHLESFKTLDRIKSTKFELVDALPPDGLAVLNIDDENVRQMAPRAQVKCVTYGIDSSEADYRAADIRYTSRGTSFTVSSPDGQQAEVQTKLLGRHNVANILAGIAVAHELGISLAKAARAAWDVEPVPHRLELKRTAGGVTIIDDAFNANPVGARMALEVLQALPGGRKILITPGMIELGERQYELNRALAVQAAAVCDTVILVGRKQTQPLQDGLKSVDFPADRFYVARDLADANRTMQSMVQAGDVVLFENDLPDTFNE